MPVSMTEKKIASIVYSPDLKHNTTSRSQRQFIFSSCLSQFLHFKSTVHPALASRGFASHVIISFALALHRFCRHSPNQSVLDSKILWAQNMKRNYINMLCTRLLWRNGLLEGKQPALFPGLFPCKSGRMHGKTLGSRPKTTS